MRISQAVLGVLVAAAFVTTDAPAQKVDEKPIVTTADAILKEFKADEQAARNKYRGKLVQVSGFSGGQTGLSTFYVKATANGPVIVKGFYNDSPKAEQAKLKAIKPDTKVVLLGKFDTFFADKIELNQARLVQVLK